MLSRIFRHNEAEPRCSNEEIPDISLRYRYELFRNDVIMVATAL